MTSRTEAAALDAADPLASFRNRFVLDDGDRIYVDGNSLGRLPLEARERIAALVEEWGRSLVTAWPRWIELPERVGDLIGRACLGAGPGTVLVADSTTVNLYKLAAAALRHRGGGVLVADEGEFPTDRYVLQGLGDVRLLRSDQVAGPTAADVATACAPGDVALVCLSLVSYRSGALADLAGITAAAHEAGALVLWDLSHAAGAVEVELEEAGVDLAVGCTYKYLNGGPGSPAYLFVRRDLQEELRSPIQGWFGQRDQFAMGPRYEPVEGIGRFAAGTPPMLGLAAVEAGVELVEEAGIGAIRAKAAALTELAIELADERLAPLGFALGTPRDAAERGAHVSLRHRGGMAGLPGADRQRERGPRLPRPGRRPARPAAALHALRRRLGRDRRTAPRRRRRAPPLRPHSQGDMSAARSSRPTLRSCGRPQLPRVPALGDRDQTVSARAPRARVMFVGEQPGDREGRRRRAGRPPLDEALEEAGIDRSSPTSRTWSSTSSGRREASAASTRSRTGRDRRLPAVARSGARGRAARGAGLPRRHGCPGAPRARVAPVEVARPRPETGVGVLAGRGLLLGRPPERGSVRELGGVDLAVHRLFESSLLLGLEQRVVLERILALVPVERKLLLEPRVALLQREVLLDDLGEQGRRLNGHRYLRGRTAAAL